MGIAPLAIDPLDVDPWHPARQPADMTKLIAGNQTRYP
jgi:hypothetical protein